MISILNLTFSVSYDNGKKYVVGTPLNWGLILEHFTIFAEVHIISINHRLIPILDTITDMPG